MPLMPVAQVVNAAAVAPSFAQIRYQTASGANPGGSTVQDAWTKYPVATEVQDDDGIVSIASSVLTFNAGTYEMTGWAFIYNASAGVLRLRNTTAGTTLVIGLRAYDKTSNGGSSGALIQGRFTVAGAQNLEIQYWADDVQASNGLGVANTDTGEVNVFGDFMFYKVA